MQNEDTSHCEPPAGTPLSGNSTGFGKPYSQHQQEGIDLIQGEFPTWGVWVVRRAVDGDFWCGARWDGTGPTFNVDSAEALAEAIRQDRGTP